MLYDDWFAQVLEGPKDVVEGLFVHIRKDKRHEAVRLDYADGAPKRLFNKWAMAVVAEHHEPDAPMVATKGGLTEGAPWGSVAKFSRLAGNSIFCKVHWATTV